MNSKNKCHQKHKNESIPLSFLLGKRAKHYCLISALHSKNKSKNINTSSCSSRYSRDPKPLADIDVNFLGTGTSAALILEAMQQSIEGNSELECQEQSVVSPSRLPKSYKQDKQLCLEKINTQEFAPIQKVTAEGSKIRVETSSPYFNRLHYQKQMNINNQLVKGKLKRELNIIQQQHVYSATMLKSKGFAKLGMPKPCSIISLQNFDNGNIDDKISS